MTTATVSPSAIDRRAWWPVALLVAIIAIAAAVAWRVEQPTLTLATHQGVEGVALRALAREYSQERGVSIEVFELPYGALYDAELRSVAGTGDVPAFDVIMVDDPWLPALIGEDDDGASTRLHRLEFTPDECRELNLADFVATTLQVSVHPLHRISPAQADRDGARPLTCGDRADGLYALPLVGNSQLFLVRKGLPRPRTWGDVRTLAEARPLDDAGYVARVGAGNSIVTDFMTMLGTLAPGEPPVSLAGTRRAAHDPFPYGEEQVLPPFEFVRELGAAPRANRGVISADDFDLAIHLVEKRASMTIAWSAWVMAIAKLPAPYNRQLLDLDGGDAADFRVTEVPGDRPVLGAWLLAIPARSANVRRARDFVLWATSAEKLAHAATLGNPSPRRSTFARAEVRGLYGSILPPQLQSLQRAQARPRTPFWRDVENVLGGCLTALYEGAMAPHDAWREAERDLDLLRARQQQIDEIRAASSGREAAEAIRRILDEPMPAAACSGRPRP